MKDSKKNSARDLDENQVAHTTWPTIYIGNIWCYAVQDMMRRASSSMSYNIYTKLEHG